MPEDYPWVRSQNELGLVFRLNIRLYQMTITLFYNEYKVAQEPVLVQQHLCTSVKFPSNLSAPFSGIFSTGLFITYSAEPSLEWLVNEQLDEI